MAESSELPTSERHAFRYFPLLFGLVAVAASVLFLVDDQGVADLDSGVVAATLLVVLSAGSVIRAVVKLLDRRTPG